ncbi:MAG TPA: ATP-dependent RNA helicase HrpA [Conexibacter sp.]|nr:ATP-dependent RNA helicase HrpA [Conexibacter sp.]
MSTTPDARADLRALRERLNDLTLHDAHRLGRRLERLRGARSGRPLERFEAEVATAEARIALRRAAKPALIEYPAELPVSGRRDDLLQTIREHQVVVVAGETGSGKSTQLPKLCLELGRGVHGTIAHTQPRRLAARTIAERVAEELRVPLGGAVGYAVRFADRSSDETLVRLMTDGLLLAEIQHDRLLRRYDTVIVDEAHERSLNIDFLLGCLKRILPRRPELKLIITSATIDPERLSKHFDDAPVVEVSGRTYPVETRYRPVPDAEHERLDAIPDAVKELLRDGPGDVLVFLSGEREIRDTAELLGGRLRSDVEILPLYARLSHAEQQKVFQGHSRRRVVLATNVAETSLTVPGIGSVVDPGTARVSRYSARLKVQRLPIEPISQASAQQRTGRCGRTSDGICIRLYDEEDFNDRPRFTDPEILRTSLASVILQMAALELGDVEDFPFLDPPDARQVRDGVALLRELGALEPASAPTATVTGEAERRGARNRLTPLGRQLAQLPVDPRFGRMVLEADKLGCAEEAIVIAAGLSIQDPRESPAEARAAAAEQHARFDRPDEEEGDGARSDFIAFLRLWRYVRVQQRELSGSQFRKRCKSEFLHFLRIREWQDLVGQLRQAAKAAGVATNAAPAAPDDVHRALLAGLLSHVGVKDVAADAAAARRAGPQRRRPLAEYTGARGARFALSPGSGLARRAPDWAMVAELVETTRLWGHTAARIDPTWVEPIAPAHLLRHSYGEPRWDERRGAAVVDERVSLYGLPIVPSRAVPYARVEPAGARELFLRRALVAGEWEARHDFLVENARRIAEVEALEDRARRRHLLADEETRFRFFDNRVPADVVSGVEFEHWWKDARQREPQLLTLPRELLRASEAEVDDTPTEWRDGSLSLPLSYRFEPGAADDGVTVHVPLEQVGELRADEFSWLVPGLRLELVTALIRSLPKELRKPLVPVPEIAAQTLAHLIQTHPPREPLLDALARELERRGVRIPREAWAIDKLPPHLRMRFRVEDTGGEIVAEGEDLVALREAVKPRLRERLAAATPSIERSGARTWDFGTLPRELAATAAGGLRAFPAVVDEGETVGVRLFETPGEQASAMHAGTRRLLLLTVRSPIPWVVDRLDTPAKLALMTAPHGNVGAALDDALLATLDALTAEAGGPAWDEAGFQQLREHVAGELADRTLATAQALVAVLEARREVERRLDALPTAAPLQEIRLDVARQLGRLVHPGCAVAAGAARLPDVARWLQGAAARLNRLPDAAGSDRDRMRTIHELESAYEGRLADWPVGTPKPPQLYEVRWMLEELRVAQFAPALAARNGGAGAPVSAKRIRRVIAQPGSAT